MLNDCKLYIFAQRPALTFENVAVSHEDSMDGFQFLDALQNFIMWLNPEKFLYEYWNKLIEATVNGNERAFTNYKVLYIRKAADQPIWERLTGHEKIQDMVIGERTIEDIASSRNSITII